MVLRKDSPRELHFQLRRGNRNSCKHTITMPPGQDTDDFVLVSVLDIESTMCNDTSRKINIDGTSFCSEKEAMKIGGVRIDRTWNKSRDFSIEVSNMKEDGINFVRLYMVGKCYLMRDDHDHLLLQWIIRHPVSRNGSASRYYCWRHLVYWSICAVRCPLSLSGNIPQKRVSIYAQPYSGACFT